jgi:hypothetical protein
MTTRDWKALADRATCLLRNADQAFPRENLQGMALQLRLWRYPSEGIRVSWSIFQPVRDYRARMPIVRQASWDPSRERKHGASVEPDIRIRDAEIDAADLDPFLKTAGGFHSGIAGVIASRAQDTSVSGVEGCRAFSHVRLEWSGRGPRPCASVISWFKRFRQLLARAFPPG